MQTERISFLNQHNEKLVGDYYPAEENKGRGVVFGHCFTCSRHTRIVTDSCKALSESGIAALRFDFSGNGQSEGNFAETTYSKHMGEMQTAVEWMNRNGMETIGLAGHSMGAAISLLTASAFPDQISAVCTLAGRYTQINAINLLDESNQKALLQNGRVDFISRNRPLSLNEAFFDDAEGYDLQQIVGNLRQPVLAIHGDRDEIIPVDEVYLSRKLKPVKTEIFVVEDADHMFSIGEHRNLIANRLTSWFTEQMNQK